MNLLQRYLIFIMILPVLGACSGSGNKSAYYQAYQQSLLDSPASAVNDDTVNGFKEIFANLQKSDELSALIDAVYADRFYFNDTFRTIRDKSTLTMYLQQTGDKVDQLDVNIQDIARSGNDVYVRWTMNMQFNVLGKKINSNSVGITHLRFNDKGQIILHQDFWDGADAFYQHLPIIGMSLRQIRGQL